MYQVSVEEHFDAAHYLRGYKGKCEMLHGHRFQVNVKVSTTELDDIGIAFDFTELKMHLKELLQQYDHSCLNDIRPFDEINPSSENIARTVYNELRDRIEDETIRLTSVDVWESPNSHVTYTP